MKKIVALFIIVVVVLSVVRCSYSDSSLDSVTEFEIEIEMEIEPDTLVKKSTDSSVSDTLLELKVIYLTIDDAPMNGSQYIDSVITAQKVKTSLFMVGNGIHGSNKFKKYYEQFKQNPYIEIYNHSYSHANNRYAQYYKNAESVLEDFERNQTEFSIGHKIARLPGRNLWMVGDKKKNMKQSGATSAELLAENGYNVFGWDIEWNYDAKDYTPKQTVEELIEEIEKLYANKKTFTPDHVILLTHDQMFANKNAKNDLASLIEKLKAAGFTFEYLSSYPEKADS